MTCATCMNGNSPCACRDNMVASNQPNLYVDPCTGEAKRVDYYQQPVAQSVKKTEYITIPVTSIINTPAADLPCRQKKTCQKQRVTKCYTCQPKRDDSYPADLRCYNLEFLDDFAWFKPGQEEDKEYTCFAVGQEFTADDGAHRVVSSSTNPYLELRVSKFKVTSKNLGRKDGVLDHYKSFFLRNSEYIVPDCGELHIEGCMSGKIHNATKHRFGDAVLNADADLRLGCAVLTAVDFESGVSIAFALTNDSIYALYERMSPLEDDDGDSVDDINSAVFLYAKLVGRRNAYRPIDDFARLGLAFDKRKGAKWYIDGVCVHNIVRVGLHADPADCLYQYGGAASTVDINCVHAGFGLMTYLDGVQPQNHGNLSAAGLGLVKLTDNRYRHPIISGQKVEFVCTNPNESTVNFGQGGMLRLKELKIELKG